MCPQFDRSCIKCVSSIMGINSCTCVSSVCYLIYDLVCPQFDGSYKSVCPLSCVLSPLPVRPQVAGKSTTKCVLSLTDHF